jgi:hypothetical protein
MDLLVRLPVLRTLPFLQSIFSDCNQEAFVAAIHIHTYTNDAPTLQQIRIKLNLATREAPGFELRTYQSSGSRLLRD